MAIKSFDDISQSIINYILTVNPNVDIKIGEAVRDLFIDVQASQIQNLYSILDFATQAQSVLSAQGPQLDRLAYNNYLTRTPAKRAVGAVTLIIKNGVQAPTLLNVGDQFYTSADQTGKVYTFILAQTMLVNTGTVQVTVPVIATDVGSTSNVPSYSIIESNYDFVDSVYNTEPTSGGDDVESDVHFAGRIPTAITGAYINVSNGIKQILANIDNIGPTPHIVTPDNPLSRGMYTVDCYLQRAASYFGTPVTESAPANMATYQFAQQPLYELNPINQVTVYDPSTNTTTVIPQVSNGIAQYSVVANGSDYAGLYRGSTRAGFKLQWNVTPPTLPYTVSYNVDQTIVDSQTAYSTYNEVVADVLFRQARAIPIWVSAQLNASSSVSQLTIDQNAQDNLNNLFGGLGITQSLSANNVIYSLLSDRNVSNVKLTNFDTNYDVVLTGSGSANAWTFSVTSPSTTALINHILTPMGNYWENDTTSPGPFSPFTIAGRLFLGNPDYIQTTGVNFTNPTNKTGVLTQGMISNVSNNWGANVDSYYDARTQTAVFSFDITPATGSTPQISFTIVQPQVSTSGTLSYLTLAPSLVQPIIQVPGTANTTTPVYATVLPVGLEAIRALVYKNGLSMVESTDNGVTGDYLISFDSTAGVYYITFVVQPNTTDILQYGLLNPDLSISLTS